MPWELYAEEPVTFEEQVVGDFLIDSETIRVEHLFNGESFPGTGYALISNVYVNNERSFFRRSYPYKNSSRIYQVIIPPELLEGGYGLHQLLMKRSPRARVDADANWRVRIDRWV